MISTREDYVLEYSEEKEKYQCMEIIEKAIDSGSTSMTIYQDKHRILHLQKTGDDELVETLSVTKSFCSMAIMFLIQDGLIEGVNDKISQYIPEWSYGGKKDITIKHILTHTSGLDRYWNYDEFMYGEVANHIPTNIPTNIASVEQISLVIDKVRENETEWYYNDTATQIIPTLVKSIQNQNISDYLNKKLFAPLGISYEWNRDIYGNNYGPNGLRISSSDLCQVGLLILNEGMWKGKRILKADLIEEMIKPRISQKEMRKCPHFQNTEHTYYGYLWYRNKDLIIAAGYLGQMLIIDRKRRLVACRLLAMKWENPNFVREVKKKEIYFKNMVSLFNNIKTNNIKINNINNMI